MNMDKKHPLYHLMKLRKKFLKDLEKRGIKPYDPFQEQLNSFRAYKDPYRIKATQDAMNSRANRDPSNSERERRQNRGDKRHGYSGPLLPSGIPKIMITAPSPEVEETIRTQQCSGSEKSQTASFGSKKVKPVDKSMTLQVPVVKKKVARNAGKEDRPEKASARKATAPQDSSKITPTKASSSKTAPTKTSSSNPNKRKATGEDTTSKKPRKRFRTKSSRRSRKPDPNQEYRSHWDPFISKHRCSKCNQPVDDDNHCYSGHRITPLKPRTKSGELIREMTQEEMLAEQEAGPPYRQEIYDSEEDDPFERIQEGMYTDDEEEGYQGYD